MELQDVKILFEVSGEDQTVQLKGPWGVIKAGLVVLLSHAAEEAGSPVSELLKELEELAELAEVTEATRSFVDCEDALKALSLGNTAQGAYALRINPDVVKNPTISAAVLASNTTTYDMEFCGDLLTPKKPCEEKKSTKEN